MSYYWILRGLLLGKWNVIPWGIWKLSFSLYLPDGKECLPQNRCFQKAGRDRRLEGRGEGRGEGDDGLGR